MPTHGSVGIIVDLTAMILIVTGQCMNGEPVLVRGVVRWPKGLAVHRRNNLAVAKEL